MYGVALHVADDVFGIISPVELGIALGQPGAGNAVDGWLRLIEARHIVEGGSSLVEGAFLELRLSEHEPCFPDEGVILAAREPLAVFVGLAPAFVPLGLGLDAVLLDGLLHLLDGAVVVASAQLAALLVADGIERQ